MADPHDESAPSSDNTEPDETPPQPENPANETTPPDDATSQGATSTPDETAAPQDATTRPAESTSPDETAPAAEAEHPATEDGTAIESAAEPVSPLDATPDEDSEDSRQRPPRGGLIAAGALIVVTLFVAAIVLGAMWFTGAWSGPSSDDPAESVDGFLTALLEDQDSEDAQSYLCQSVSGDISTAMGFLDSGEASSMFTWSDVKKRSESGDTAVVTAKVSLDTTGQSWTWTFAVVTGDPDNAWRVCGIDTGAESES